MNLESRVPVYRYTRRFLKNVCFLLLDPGSEGGGGAAGSLPSPSPGFDQVCNTGPGGSGSVKEVGPVPKKWGLVFENYAKTGPKTRSE